MICFARKVIYEYFKKCAIRNFEAAASYFKHYPRGSLGYNLGKLHLAFGNVWYSMARAMVVPKRKGR
jgi:hypothetical protein